MRLALLVHLLGVVFWVGGMAFAHVALRPAVAAWDPPARLRLLHAVFVRFIPLAGIAVVAILVSGVWMIALLGGMDKVAVNVHGMATLGVVMMIIYVYILLRPYRALRQAVAAEAWKPAGEAMRTIRVLVTVNLALGVIVIAIATLPWW
ncbi:MAG TPA: CopD family protein [Casimicrobiaceae bacterium]|nr:CopD family protein [Casimicrobiaceae bacterium]